MVFKVWSVKGSQVTKFMLKIHSLEPQMLKIHALEPQMLSQPAAPYILSIALPTGGGCDRL